MNKELENLKQENKQLKERIHKALKMIWKNYGVLDKYGIELLEDILKDDLKNEKKNSVE